MKVSVVIPSLYEKDGEYLKLCVESLRATTDWDIIVVTNGTETSPKLDHIHGITRHLHTRDQGQCIATNIGASAVSPDMDYIMVCNSDMYFAPDWNKHLEFKHLCFSPNLVEPTNNLGSAPPFLKCDGGFTLDEFNKQEVDHLIKVNKETSEETGFNLPFFIRKDVWDTLGGYDTKYDPWGSNSDSDLQAKIHLAGITPMRLRGVLVYHFSNKSGTFDQSNMTYWQRNWDHFTDKWGFNRDQLGSDVWYSKDILPKDDGQIQYRPSWKGAYA